MDLILLCLLFYVFFLLGDGISSRFGLVFSEPLENFVICAVLGLIAVSSATTLLSFFGLIYPATAWMILTATFLSGTRKTWQTVRALPVQAKAILSPNILRLQWFDAFNLCVLAILFFCALTLAQTPPTRTDTLVYHFAIPKAYLEHHGFVNLPNNIFSFFPLQMEMLFLFCMALKGEILAQLAGVGLLALLLLAMILYYKRNVSRKFIFLVPVLFFSTPTFFEGSTTAYVDVAVAGFMFFAFYAWDRMRSESAWVFPLAVFAGSAAGTKLLAGIVLPLAIFGILLHKKSLRGTFKPALILLFGVFIFLLPWWIKNYQYSGNPFVPLFMKVFGGEDRINWDANRFLQLDQFSKAFDIGRGIKDFFLLPIHLTFLGDKNGPRFDGDIGIMYLLLLPGLLFLWKENVRKRIIPLAFVFFALLICWFLQLHYIRFLAPAFSALVLLLVYGFERMVGWGYWIRRGLPIIAAMGIVYNLSSIITAWVHAEPLPYLLGSQSRGEYLTRHIPAYPMYQTMNRTLNDVDVALFVYMRNFGYLCEKKFVSDSLFEAHTMQAILSADSSIEGISRQMRQRGITHLMFDNDFVFGNNSAFTSVQLEALKHFLNSRAKLVDGKNGYFLYRFVLS